MEDILKNSAEAAENKEINNEATTITNNEFSNRSNDKIFNRRERRSHLNRHKYHKQKRSLMNRSLPAWLDVVADNIEKGKELHTNNERIWRTNTENFFHWKEKNIRDTFKKIGKDDKYINDLIENWYDKVL